MAIPKSLQAIVSTTILAAVLIFAGCFADNRPKQTLHFKATPLPGANSGQIDMERVEALVKRRLAVARLKVKYQVEVQGLNKLAVTVRGADQATLDKIGQYVTDWGMLEFAAVAHADDDGELIALAQEADSDVRVDGQVQAEWIPVRQDASGKPHGHLGLDNGAITRDREVDGKNVREWLIIYEPGQRITGNLLKNATADYDETGRPAIQFTLNAEGAGNMHALTSALEPRGAVTRRLAIILNGTIHSAPSVQSAISARGQITGEYTREEIDNTVNILRSGSLPCQLTFEEVVDESKAK